MGKMFFQWKWHQRVKTYTCNQSKHGIQKQLQILLLEKKGATSTLYWYDHDHHVRIQHGAIFAFLLLLFYLCVVRIDCT